MFEDAMYIVPEGDTRTILIKASVQYVDSFNVSLIHNASAGKTPTVIRHVYT